MRSGAELSGYLILGAGRDGAGWNVPGLTFPHDEPRTWISSVLERGLEPSPVIDVASFEREDGRHLAVVRVPPIFVPPAVTVDGIVYRRVSGQTQPVTSQVVLTELIQAGRFARKEAEGKALRAAQHALGETPPRLSRNSNMFALALCPVEGPEDRMAVLFSEQFVKGLSELADSRLQPNRLERYSVGVEVRQAEVRAFPRSHQSGMGRMVLVHWGGAVAAVYAADPDDAPSRLEMTEQVAAAWTTLAQAATALRGSGETHVVLVVNAEHPVARQAPAPPEPIRRWTTLVEPEAEDMGRVQRELSRALGTLELEP